MTDVFGDRLELLFHQVVELPPEARRAFLDDACADDAALRAELESLLQCDRPALRSGTFLQSPVVRAARDDDPGFDPPAQPDEIGLVGPYRLIKALGQGGMGKVYEALDTRLGRRVALKVLLPQYAADAASQARFLREARAAAQVVHDNVVTVYESDQHGGVFYMAMQFLEGTSLDGYLREQGPPPLPLVLQIAREAAAGLAAAHQAGLVHRDIKPANLWLEAPAGRIKVLDFGLAKPLDAELELTVAGAIVGTPAYMSPEQARGEKLDHRTDIFSLGAVLYRLCGGRLPFEGPTTMGALMALAAEEPPPLATLNPAIPASLAKLIHEMLSKRREERPASASQVVARLQTIHESDAPERVSRPAPPSSARRRALLGGSVLLVVMAGVLVWNEVRKPETIPSPALSQKQTTEARPDSDPQLQLEATRWVLSMRGFVRISDADGNREVKANDQIPPGPFVITQVDFSSSPGFSSELDLSRLAGLRLTHLNLHGSPVTDARLEQLASLQQVNYANLSRTEVTNDGLKHLKNLRGLDFLYLNETAITDAGLVHLADVKGLAKLHLDRLAITDAGLKHLAGIKSLTYLNVQGTGVTLEGLRAFQSAVPGCTVEYDGGILPPLRGHSE